LLQSLCQGKLFAERTGQPPPEIVGLHGWGRSHDDLIGALGEMNALLIDLPGFGSSPGPASPWGSLEYAELVAEALRAFDRRLVLVGHSFGGRVAVRLAARWPELVSGVVLAGVPLLRCADAAAPSFPFRMARWGSRHGLVSGARMERLRQRHGSDDYRRARGIMRSVLVRVVNESYEEDLPRITCPVELVWGSEDTEAPLKMAERACSLIPEGRLEVIDGAGHFTPFSHPAVLSSSAARLVKLSSS
jgi:pimeloyl-ACP methyl ester carboxylesterase